MTHQSDEYSAKREHMLWLEDYAYWRSEHRQALMMLTKIQATILKREEMLETQAAEVHTHELHLQDYEVVEYGPGSPNFESLEAAHAEFEKKHKHVREVYEQTKSRHVSILGEVQKLFEFSEVTTNRPAT